MDNLKDDKYYMKKAIKEIETIQSYTSDMSYEEFEDDELTIDAVMFRLVQMVEHIKKISKEYRDEHDDIKWVQIFGFRNGIVHDYGRTDYTVVFEIIKNDLPVLKSEFRKAVQNK